MPRIYNHTVLLVFNSGTTPQQVESKINVPFDTKRMVFHPPYVQILAADVKEESYVLQSNLNPDGVGVVGTFAGFGKMTASAVAAEVAAVADDTKYAGQAIDTGGERTNKDPVVIHLKDPVMISGEYRFLIRGLTQVAGGAAVPISCKVVQQIEFHSE